MLSERGLGLSAVMLPMGLGLTVLVYLPVFAGMAHVWRVRSGEMRDQEWPWSTLFQTTFDAKMVEVSVDHVWLC